MYFALIFLILNASVRSAFGGPCQTFRGPFLSFQFSHHVSLSFFLRFFISYKIYSFSVLNLRSTTYSKKLIAAIVLHTISAFCSCKRVNNVTKLSIKEGKGWRKMDQGIAVF